MSALEDLFAKLQGRDPDEEAATKKRADQAAAKYSSDTGAPDTEEPGIQPDEVTEGLVTTAVTGPVAGLPGRIGTFATKKAASSALDKLKEEGMPGNRPTFSEAVQTGQAGKGPSEFSKFIRKGSDIPTEQPLPLGSSSTPAAGTSKGMASEPVEQFNGLSKYGPTDEMSRVQQTGMIDKLKEQRDMLYQKEGMSQRVKDLNRQISDMRVTSPLNQNSGVTSATTGFQSRPGIYVNPKLK